MLINKVAYQRVKVILIIPEMHFLALSFCKFKYNNSK